MIYRFKMLWVVLLGAILATLSVANADRNFHEAATPEELRQIESVLLDPRSETNVRRDLQQSWTKFNDYFSGTPGQPSPRNLPTYYGRDPGPCPLTNANRAGNRCKARACKMPQSIKDIILDINIGPINIRDEIENLIVCNDCTTYPGWIYLYELDAGNLYLGGLFLDTVVPGSVDTVTPPGGFAPAASAFQSETSHYNQFRMTLTLSELSLFLQTKADIENLRTRPLTVYVRIVFNIPVPIPALTLNLNGVGVTLQNQRKDSTYHALSFRSELIFRANRRCLNGEGVGNAQRQGSYNTTCFYRSDKVRNAYYRASGDRTESFKEGVVYDLMFPVVAGTENSATPTINDAVACQFDFNGKQTDLGLSLDVGELCYIGWPLNWDPCRSIVNAILNIVVGLIIKDILCQIIIGTFWIINENKQISGRGLINKGIENLYIFFRKYVEDPLTSKVEMETLEDVTIPNRFRADGYDWPNPSCTGGYCPYPGAIDFNTSEIFKAVSLGLNGILGNVSTTPEYQSAGKLTIVEVIDILTGNKEGIIQLGICRNGTTPTNQYPFDPPTGTCEGDIKAELKLDDYPRFEWTGQPVFDGFIQLNGIVIYGVNSITRLKLLDNGFVNVVNPTPNFTHTVQNSFSMTKFGIELYVIIRLVDGTWVHRPRNTLVPANQKRVIDMNTNIIIEVGNIDLDLDLMMLLYPDRMNDKLIGSVFGKFPPGSTVQRLRCSGFALDILQIQRLQVRGTLTRLEFKDLLNDLGTVITAGTRVFDYGYRQATALFLPFLSDNWAKPFLNQVLMNNTYDGICAPDVNGTCTRPNSTDVCFTNYTYYYAPDDPNRYINFYDSKAWNAIKGIVNDVVGGVPVRTGSASINTIIDKYLEWYVPVAAVNNVTLQKLPNFKNPERIGNVDVLSSSIKIQGEIGGSGAPDPNKVIEFSNFGVRNLGSVHELKINPNNPTETRNFRLDFKIGGGKIWDRSNGVYLNNGLLGLKFHARLRVSDVTESVLTNYAQDEADVTLEFGNLTVGADIYALVNQNEILDLKYGQLTSLSCLLTIVDDFELRTLTVGFQSFRLNVTRVNPANPSIKWRSRDFCSNPWVPPSSIKPWVSTVYGTPCGDDAARRLRMSDAIDRLAAEATVWNKTVDNMLKYLFNGVAKQVMNAVNAFAGFNYPIANCSDYQALDGTFLDGILNSFENATDAGEGALSYYEKLAIDQKNPRFPAVVSSSPAVTMYGSRSIPPLAINYANPTEVEQRRGFQARICSPAQQAAEPTACWEDSVVGADDGNELDLRNNYIVNEVKKFLDKAGQKVVIDAMNAISTTSGNFLGDSLIATVNGTALPSLGLAGSRGLCNNVISGEASYCIDLDANLTGMLPKLNDSTFIPGLIVEFKRLRVLNIHTFDAQPEEFELMKPYVPDQYNPDVAARDTRAKFSLAHRIKFSGTAPLDFTLDVDISVAEEFLNLDSPTPKKPITDTMTLGFKFKQLDIQVMTMTAINYSRVLEVPLFYFLDPFNAEKCFFSIFYQNGFQFPQFQVYVSDIVGPTVTFSGKSPAQVDANIFSQGIADLIGASIEIMFQLIKKDFPDATQGEFRKYLNRVFGEFVTAARDAAGPGSCPLIPCGAPDSFCHYIDWSASPQILDTLNSAIGGDPVSRSAVDVNTLLERAIDYALIDPNGLNLTQNVANPSPGDYTVTSILSFTAGNSSVRVKNLRLEGLDSIYKLTFSDNATKPYTLGFDLSLGGGVMKNGSNTPPTLYTSDPLMLSADIELVTKIQRPGSPLPPLETIANNEFRVQLIFKGFNVTSIQEILVNKTDLYSLSISQVTSSQCVLAVIDKITLETIYAQITDFDIVIPQNDCETTPACVAPKYGRDPNNCKVPGGGKCNIGIAINTLRGEAANSSAVVPPAQSVPLSMINTVLRNIGDTLVESFNTAIDPWNATLAKCDIPRATFRIVAGVTNQTHANKLITRLITNVTGIVTNPRPVVSSGFRMITVQSDLLAGTTEERDGFIEAVIRSARDARGAKPEPAVELEEASYCDRFNLPAYLSVVCSGLTDARANLSAKLEEWTTQQPNLIEFGESPLVIEDRVRVDTSKDQFYDIRTSAIVDRVTQYFDDNAGNFNQLLKEVANTTDIFRVENDGSVSLVVNMTDGLLWIDQNFLTGTTCEGEQVDMAFRFQDLLGTSNSFIPGLRILPGLLEITNFGEFTELILLRPYKAQNVEARFTTRHEFGWRNASKPLDIKAGIDIFYDRSFRNGAPAPLGIIDKETVNVTLTIKEMLIQVLTLLAVDTRALGEIRLGDFLEVNASQIFKRNCKAATCLMTSIYDGGIYIPQITVSVADIIGPRITTTRQLFSLGVEQLVDALVEIVVQVIRDDLPAVTQGPLRDYINGKLIRMVTDAKQPGACPERRNYTRTYPNGEFYCSHADGNASSPLLTQNEESCKIKGDGRTCEWAPPDGEITENTVACFYTRESRVLNFATSPGLTQLKNFVDDSLMNPDSSFYVNSFLSAFAGSITTDLAKPIDNFPLAYNGAEYGKATVGFGALNITGLNTIDRLQILDVTPFAPGGDGQFLSLIHI